MITEAKWRKLQILKTIMVSTVMVSSNCNTLWINWLSGRAMFRCQISIEDYVSSNEWMLLEYPAVRHEERYPCCIEPYPDLTFTIRVKRIAVFYSFILVLPCVLLSLLTLVSFWLPPESPAKVLLGTSYNNMKSIFAVLYVSLCCWPYTSLYK